MKLFTVLACSLLLTACNRSNTFSDLQAFVNEVNSRPGAEVEPVPEFVPYEGFIYGAASMRSPFQVPLIIDSVSGIVLAQDVEPDFDRIPELLENQSLSELSMVGMLQRDGVFEALVEDGFGEVHRVGAGDHMGRNYGQVKSISETQLNMIEIVPSGNGGWVERPQTLTLQ
ncbi:MAG: pilus assembly protein PilP [SAR86 cluster bacterium]|uniref:Pilus assembly protein PilP n=1 Tax=SAR86 cluster bacterium TaxID=2030880 RepID=A0A2A5B3M7_9GAMM|nr:MAG: pilus assembly protein PilP [SAR86 cluster bacterium]